MDAQAISVRRFGVWAAIAAAVAAVGYDIPQVLQVLGCLADPWDRILIFAPSLALAPAFVLATAAAHVAAPPALKVWSLAALALAILYAADVSMIYVVQLGVVIPRDMGRPGPDIAYAACCSVGAPLRAVDLLGYTYMSLSTLLLAPAFPGPGARRRLRLALIANGVLAPILLAQLAWPWLIYVASPWIVTFPLSMILLARALGEKPDKASAEI